MTVRENCLVIDGRPMPAPDGLRVRNFLDPNVARFRGGDRTGRPVNEIVVHESVTRSAASTVSVLRGRGLGVHLIVAPDGTVTQHGDLATDRLAHAGRHNGPSVGVEVVNPYYPTLLRPGLPWSRTIAAVWAHRGRYVLPTPAQAEACATLIGWLTSDGASGLSIPRTWIGHADGRLALGRVAGAEQRRPGVYAHHYFAHADGVWLVLYAWLRLGAGLPAEAVFEEAVARSSGSARTADINDLIPRT